MIFDDLYTKLRNQTARYTIREKIALLENAARLKNLRLLSKVIPITDRVNWRDIMQFVPEGYRLELLQTAISLSERK